VDEVLEDAQVRHLESFYQVRHPVEGEVWGVFPPARFDGQRPGAITPPPLHGEHNEEILGELGFDRGQRAELKAGKVV
jgi:crotonobetainyl-CoA:carnitine CoA-transferase CaiB-like acyl-CoA transferase